MRTSFALLILAAAGLLAGAYLAGGLAVLGGALMADSVALGVLALLRDDGRPVQADEPSLSTLERFRNAA